MSVIVAIKFLSLVLEVLWTAETCPRESSFDDLRNMKRTAVNLSAYCVRIALGRAVQQKRKERGEMGIVVGFRRDI